MQLSAIERKYSYYSEITYHSLDSKALRVVMETRRQSVIIPGQPAKWPEVTLYPCKNYYKKKPITSRYHTKIVDIMKVLR